MVSLAKETFLWGYLFVAPQVIDTLLVLTLGRHPHLRTQTAIFE
jgi:hypothetical protein